MEKAQTEGYKSSIQELGEFLTTGSRFPSRRGSTQTSKGKYQAVILRQGFGPAFFYRMDIFALGLLFIVMMKLKS